MQGGKMTGPEWLKDSNEDLHAYVGQIEMEVQDAGRENDRPGMA